MAAKMKDERWETKERKIQKTLGPERQNADTKRRG
jgi:hypothetical protein